MNVLVTGSSGFIGRHLIEHLMMEPTTHTLVEYDRPLDITQQDKLTREMAGIDIVVHLAALADVRNALKRPIQQVHDNLLLTQMVLEAMRSQQVPRIVFMSTAVVYGDCTDSPITERGTCFPQQTSIYGAMKLASESLIAAYCHGYGMVGDVLRTVSVVGPGYRHGNLMDFYRKLLADPTKLEIYGTGCQQKYYIAVDDLCDAVVRVMTRAHTGCEIWNVSHDQPNTINDSITAVSDALAIHPAIHHQADPWAGDLPGLVLDCSKLRALGWVPQVPITDAMRATVQDFIKRHL